MTDEERRRVLRKARSGFTRTAVPFARVVIYGAISHP